MNFSNNFENWGNNEIIYIFIIPIGIANIFQKKYIALLIYL